MLDEKETFKLRGRKDYLKKLFGGLVGFECGAFQRVGNIPHIRGFSLYQDY